MLSRLPPVGQAIKIKRDALTAAPIVAGYESVFVQSGTAALALALQAAAKSAAVANPQVLIPAYACPDLVSAAVFAGVRPVLVDLEPDSTYMSLNALRHQMCPSTVAVIAVNFLGIPERTREIADLLADKSIVLIEDNAQWFPPPGGELWGDYSVLSFGRGKPVSLLGGGVLLHRQSLTVQSQAAASASRRTAQLNILLRFLLYNTLRNPFFYGGLERLPFLNLGATEYKPLTYIQPIESYRASYLRANITAHLQRRLDVQQQMQAMTKKLPAHTFVDLPLQHCASSNRLLRYPLLAANAAKRNDWLTNLRSAGLGASALYGKTLPEISGVKALVDSPENLPNARSFANRLVTLPLHEQVTARQIEQIYDCLVS